MCVGEIMQLVNCAPAKQLKMCWWMDLLSLAIGTHWDRENANGCITEMKHVQTFSNKKSVYM